MNSTIWKRFGCPIRAVLLAGVLASIGPATAGSISITGGNGTDVWDPETGQSVPGGTAGFLGGTVFAVTADFYTFTYGGGGLIAGDTGHGDSIFTNEFWVGANRAAAVAAGHIFCTLPGDPSCGGLATPVNSEFTLFLPAGAISFGFNFGATTSNVLLNGQINNSAGAYLSQVGLGVTANAGPGYVAYLGLTDGAYPGSDHDFQDLVVRVSSVPEPGALLLSGLGLIAIAFLGRRRRQPIVSHISC